MHKLFKNKQLLTIILASIFLIITLSTSIAAVVNGTILAEDKPIETSVPQTVPQVTSVPQTSPPVTTELIKPDLEQPPTNNNELFNRPDEMKAVYLTPGVDFMSTTDTSSSKVKTEVDKALATAKKLTMNTIIINTRYKDSVIYKSNNLPSSKSEFDVFDYIVTRAKEENLYVYGVYNANMGTEGLGNSHIDRVAQNTREFTTSYPLDGILIDDYYNKKQSTSYSTYLSLGGGIGFNNFMKESPKTILSTVSDIIRNEAKGTQVGLLADPVWENKSTNPLGSNTSAAFTALSGGNADTKTFIENGKADFVSVKALGALGDKTMPFKEVVTWWGKLATSNNIPMYVTHASSKAAEKTAGWTEPDQLTKQLAEVKSIEGYSGSAYDSLKALTSNELGSNVEDYYKDETKPEQILSELAVTKPAKTTYQTFEPNVIFAGASDSTKEVKINDDVITTDKNGYFNITKELKPGLNTFTITHKSKSIQYNITRQVQVLKEISPVGNMSVEGDMQITITATAYINSIVTATINGQTLSMNPMSSEDDSVDKDSTYQKYSCVFTAPSAGSSVKNIGNITVYAEWNGNKDSKQGANVSINKKAAMGSGSPVQIVVDQAETFPTNKLDDYSDPKFYPLPRGTLDYTIGDEIVYKEGNSTYKYYILESGSRVYSSNINSVSERISGNEITGIDVIADGRYTNVRLTMSEKAAYSLKYDASGISVKFHYTKSVPSSMSLNKNPLFNAANWSETTLNLKFIRSGGFLGYKAFYEGNTLVFRFNNSPGGLSGANIVVDPGHGGSDPGAAGQLPSYPESKINWDIASKLADSLRASGANVTLINTQGGNKVSLESRMSQARSVNPHLYISVHCNTAASSTAKGTEVYYFYPYAQGFASNAASKVSSALNTNNRGARYSTFYVTRESQFASILTEVGFISTVEEHNKIINENHQLEIAKGIASAAGAYLSGIGGGGSTGSDSNGDVTSVAVESVVLNKYELSLNTGASETLMASVSPSNATDKDIIWSSSSDSVAIVSQNGKVTAKYSGSGQTNVIITATSKSDPTKKALCIVTIKPVAQSSTVTSTTTTTSSTTTSSSTTTNPYTTTTPPVTSPPVTSAAPPASSTTEAFTTSSQSTTVTSLP